LHQKSHKMIRISLVLVFLASLTTLSAQEAYSVFVDKVTVNWFQDAVVEYNNNVKQLESTDKTTRIKSISKLEKIINQLSKNSPAMLFTMNNFLDEEKNKALSNTQMVDGVKVNALDQRNARIRVNDNLTEIVLTMDQFASFKANLEKIKALNNDLSSQDFVAAERKLASTDKLMIISEAANANRDLLINNSVVK